MKLIIRFIALNLIFNIALIHAGTFISKFRQDNGIWVSAFSDEEKVFQYQQAITEKFGNLSTPPFVKRLNIGDQQKVIAINQNFTWQTSIDLPYVIATDDLTTDVAIAFYIFENNAVALIRTSPIQLIRTNYGNESETKVSFNSRYQADIDKVITFFRCHLGSFEKNTVITITSGYLSTHLIAVMNYLQSRGLKISYLSVNDAVMEPFEDGVKVSYNPNILSWHFDKNRLVLKNTNSFALPKEFAINAVDGSVVSKFSWTLRFPKD